MYFQQCEPRCKRHGPRARARTHGPKPGAQAPRPGPGALGPMDPGTGYCNAPSGSCDRPLASPPDPPKERAVAPLYGVPSSFSLFHGGKEKEPARWWACVNFGCRKGLRPSWDCKSGEGLQERKKEEPVEVMLVCAIKPWPEARNVSPRQPAR